MAACGGIFHDRNGSALGYFDFNLGISFSLHAELTAAMLAIELAFNKGWKRLWFEYDSSLILAAFQLTSLVPWRLRSRCNNCLHLDQKMEFSISHIYLEGNTCTDKLANFGIHSQGYTWRDSIPSFLSEEFNRNRFNLPNYRFKRFFILHMG